MSSKIFYLVLWGIISQCKAEQVYDTKYDNMDWNEILNNDRLLKNYVKCLESEGPCTPEGKQLKDTIPDAIATDCAKCSEKQRQGSEIVMHFLIDNKPADWERLEKLYDPQGEYRSAYLATVTGQPINEQKN